MESSEEAATSGPLVSTGDSEAPPPSLGQGGRVAQWFWGASEMADARRAAKGFSKDAVEASRQARLAAEVAHNALKPIEPFRNGPTEALACHLYGQSIFWLLRALLLKTTADSVVAERVRKEEPSLRQLWQWVDEQQLLPAPKLCKAEAPELEYEALRQLLMRGSAEAFAALPLAKQRALTRRLKELSQVLLATIDSPFVSRSIWRRRIARSSGLVAVVSTLVLSGVALNDWYQLNHDLSRGKPWKASSKNKLGCRSPERSCEGSENFFFHTRKQSEPWFEIDLEKVTSFSSVYIVNRVDCCTHRAIPLIVEVWQNDQWKEVARRNDKFKTWRPSFKTVQASKLRLRVGRWSYLHLSDVRILP